MKTNLSGYSTSLCLIIDILSILNHNKTLTDEIQIRKSLDEDIAKRIVYPNKILIPMTGSAMDPMAVKAFEPMGALGVRMLRGSGLPKKSGLRTLIGQHKPDAYAKIKVGATMYETEVVKNTTDPEWDGKW